MGVTGETLVLTSNGYQQVGDLVNEIFKLVVDDEEYDTVGYGFSCDGNRDVYKIYLENGSYLKASDHHKLLNNDGEWVRVDEIEKGDVLWNGNVVEKVGYLGCFYVYDCIVHNYNKYITEGGFYNKAN